MHWQRIAQLCSIPGILIAAEYILMYSLQLSSGCLQTHACSLLGNNIHFRVVSFLIKFLLAFPVEACIVFHSWTFQVPMCFVCRAGIFSRAGTAGKKGGWERQSTREACGWKVRKIAASTRFTVCELAAPVVCQTKNEFSADSCLRLAFLLLLPSTSVHTMHQIFVVNAALNSQCSHAKKSKVNSVHVPNICAHACRQFTMEMKIQTTKLAMLARPSTKALACLGNW